MNHGHRRSVAIPTLLASALALASAATLHANPSAPPGSHSAPQVSPGGGGATVSPFITSLNANPNDPLVKAFAAAQKVRIEQERELRKLRAKYFLGSNNTEMRQIGIARLREFSDPAIYPAMLKVFEHDARDIREAILDHLLDQKTDEADTTLAWAAIFDKDKWFRESAAKRLLKRLHADAPASPSPAPGASVASAAPSSASSAAHAPTEAEIVDDPSPRVSSRIKSVIAYALRSDNNTTVAAAADLSGTLGLLEAIPALINAQVVPGRGGAGGNVVQDDTSLAYILVGTQQAFVADLTPVVGDSAVAFDPTLGVVTDGVYVRVIDALVITYRNEVHNALVNLSTRGWDGRSTASLGWDQQAWRDWYANEYLPFRKQLAEARKVEAAARD